MLPGYFHYIFVHLRQKVRLRPELNPEFLSTLSPNPTGNALPDLQLCEIATFWRKLLISLGLLI